MISAFMSATLLTPRANIRGVNHVVQSRRARAAVSRPRAVVTSPETSEETTWPDAAAMSTTPVSGLAVLDINAVMEALPHRFPFLLVDRVVAVEDGKAIGIKAVSVNEPFFPGHFPGRPIMPGVLQIEALAQLAGIVLQRAGETSGAKEFFFGGVDGVRWRSPVVPGDTIVMEVEMKSFKKRFGIAKFAGK